MNDSVQALGFHNENSLLYAGGNFGEAGGIASSYIAVWGPKQVPGDLDRDEDCNLADAIIGLQVLTGQNPASLRKDFTISVADIDGNKQVGSEEVIYILRTVAGR
jgi:hypothetical protein